MNGTDTIGTIILILASAGVCFCFFTYKLTRILPALIGLSLGVTLGVCIKTYLIYGVFALNQSNIVFIILNGDPVNAMIRTLNIVHYIIAMLVSDEWLWVPVVCALLFTALGSIFPRIITSLSVTFSFVMLTYSWFLGLNSALGWLFVLGAAVGLFTLIFFTHKYTIIGISVADGAMFLSLSAMYYLKLSARPATVMLVSLLIICNVLQGVKLHRRHY